jgi:GxxExxY protein
MDANEISHKIIGCAMQVHNALGNGFQEVIYQRALAIEMNLANLEFRREIGIPIFYRNKQVGTRRVDFFVENSVMVELKVIEKLMDKNKDLANSDLEAFHIADGLLINFGGSSLEFERLYNKKLVNPENIVSTQLNN